MHSMLCISLSLAEILPPWTFKLLWDFLRKKQNWSISTKQKQCPYENFLLVCYVRQEHADEVVASAICPPQSWCSIHSFTAGTDAGLLHQITQHRSGIAQTVWKIPTPPLAMEESSVRININY